MGFIGQLGRECLSCNQLTLRRSCKVRVVPCSNACLSSQCLFKLNGLGEGEKPSYKLVKSNEWAFGPDWSIGTVLLIIMRQIMGIWRVCGLVIDKQRHHLGALSKSYGEECFFVVNHFLEYKRVEGFLNLCSFPGSHASSKVQQCQSSPLCKIVKCWK